jgi:hypothetical protein
MDMYDDPSLQTILNGPMTPVDELIIGDLVWFVSNGFDHKGPSGVSFGMTIYLGPCEVETMHSLLTSLADNLEPTQREIDAVFASLDDESPRVDAPTKKSHVTMERAHAFLLDSNNGEKFTVRDEEMRQPVAELDGVPCFRVWLLQRSE